jgi:hypothetical protein
VSAGLLRGILVFVLLALVPQAHAQSGPAEARFGVVVTSLANISPAAGSFEMTAYAWAIDPTGSFDGERDLQILARHATIAEVERATMAGGATYTAYRIEATVDQDFDLRRYPFDRQTLRLPVETEIPPSQLQPVTGPEDSRIADFLVLNGWNVSNLRFETRTADHDAGFGQGVRPSFTRLTLLIDIERQRSPLVIDKVIGYTAALLIAALIYLVPPGQLGVRIGMVTSAVFAAVGTRYGLDAALGAESGFGLVDQLSLIVFGAIIAALVVSLLVHHLHEAGRKTLAIRLDLGAGLVAAVLSFGLAVAAILSARG